MISLHYFTKSMIPEIPGLVLKDLGIAFVVAFGVTLAVEKRAAEEKNRDLRRVTEERDATITKLTEERDTFFKSAIRDTMEAYFEKELPPRWFEYLRDQINRENFIRNNLTVTLTLRESIEAFENESDQNDFLIIEQEIKYEVTNISRDDLASDIHNVQVFIEKPVEERFKDLVACEDFEIDGVPLTDQQMAEADLHWDNDAAFKKFIWPIKVPKGGTISVFTRCKTVKYKRDHFVWVTASPSRSLETICKPCEGIVANMSLLHPDLADKDPKSTDNGRSVLSEVKNPVMAMTAVEFAWQPKRA